MNTPLKLKRSIVLFGVISTSNNLKHTYKRYTIHIHIQTHTGLVCINIIQFICFIVITKYVLLMALTTEPMPAQMEIVESTNTVQGLRVPFISSDQKIFY